MPQTNPISIGFGIGESELKMFYDDRLVPSSGRAWVLWLIQTR